MELKEEVRRRIADLTRSAYERGYRDGAQSALAEIENVSASDLADQLKGLAKPMKVLPKKVALAGRAALKGKKIKAEKAPAKEKAPKAKAKREKSAESAGPPKAAVVAACIEELFAAKGEARRDEVLAAARAKNAEITSQDVSNGIRTLTRREAIRIASDDSARLLPPATAAAPA